MIRVLILQIILGLFLSLNALEWQDEYEDARAKAVKEDKIIYAFIVSNSCRWCRKMEETTMVDKSIIKRLEKDFAVVELIRGFDTYPDKLTTKMVPRHFFFTPNEEKIASIPGYWDVEDFGSILDDMVSKYKKLKGNNSETNTDR
jgi:thioredoxin-related protein